MKEDWKAIEGYEGYYQVSNRGQVRSLDRKKKGRHDICYWMKGRILKPRIDSRGYAYVVLSVNRKKKAKTVHRLVAEAFISNPEDKPQVNHIDGDKSNNKAYNLEWCTQSENMIHAYENGLQKPISGKNHYAAKLTDEDITEIMEMRKRGITYKGISDNFNVKAGAISAIVNGRNWKHVTND